MNKLRNLSGLTKANVLALIIFTIISFLGHIVIWNLYLLAPYGFMLLVGQSITVALNDPDAEEPVPLALRAAIGYGIGIAFGVGLLIVNAVISSHLYYTIK
jgi:hypothetical protein